MKKVFTSVVLVLALFACKQSDKGGAASGTIKVKGLVAGLDSGWVEYLLPSAESNKFDSAAIKNGKFEFSKDVNETEFVVLRLAGQQGAEIAFFADPGTVEITANKDSMWTSEIKAGNTQKKFEELNGTLKSIMEKGQAMYPAYMQAQQAQDMEAIKRIESEMMMLQEQARDTAVKFALKNHESVVAPYLGMVYLANDPSMETQLKALYDTLSPAIKETYFAKKLNEKIASTTATSVGATAPDISLANPNGQNVSLSSLRGQYVLLDFWASWCAPCREENPNIVNAYNKYKDKGFTIYGVSLDRDRDKWLKAIEDDKLTWTHVSDLKYWSSEPAKLYGIQAIPANFLLDKEGKIIAKNLRGEDLEAKLAEVLN